MYKPFRALFILLPFLIGSHAQAQQLTNSPYSRYGIGDIQYGTGNIRSSGMGQVGVANANAALVNSVNPALLYYNNSVTFEMSLASEFKRLKSGSLTQNDASANFNQLTLAIPVSRRWTTALGLRPYSSVNYDVFEAGSIEGGDPTAISYTQYKGSGGINEVFFAHGVRLFKGLSIGASGSYLFGTVDRESSTVVIDTANDVLGDQKAVILNSSRYSGVMLQGGIHYRKDLSKNLNVGVGATYTAESAINTDRRVSSQRRQLDDYVFEENIIDSADGFTTVPRIMQFGIAFDNNKSWSIGADYSSYKNSTYRGFSYNKNAGSQDMNDGYRVGLGGEITPDANSVGSYFKRVTYRIGGYYGKSELNASAGVHELRDMGLTWGLSLPVSRGVRPPDYTQTYINTSFAIGKRDALVGSNISELYFRFNLGFTFNNRWFIKRKFD